MATPWVEEKKNLAEAGRWFLGTKTVTLVSELKGEVYNEKLNVRGGGKWTGMSTG